MEDVLDIYERPYDSRFPVVCMDGQPVQLIDAIAVRKGHNYMTVIAEYFTGRVVWMGPGRDKKTLGRFVATLNTH